MIQVDPKLNLQTYGYLYKLSVIILINRFKNLLHNRVQYAYLGQVTELNVLLPLSLVCYWHKSDAGVFFF